LRRSSIIGTFVPIGRRLLTCRLPVVNSLQNGPRTSSAVVAVRHLQGRSMTDAPAVMPESGFNVLLTDGSTAHIRAIRPTDGDSLRDFHRSLSTRSIVSRYLGPHPVLSDKEVDRFTNVDNTDRVAFVVERSGHIVAVARYDRPPGRDEAEVAFVVLDEYQGRGIGTILLKELAIVARRHGIRHFVADTFSDNSRMLGVFSDTGFARSYSRSGGVVQVVLDIDPTPAAVDAADERERQTSLTAAHEMRP
jgi:GNAT superfamily N-acetyltransferase